MKKYLLVLSLVATLLLVACGGNKPDNNKGNSDSAATWNEAKWNEAKWQ